jgi:Asp-tRNA(Asn)/Glu-tRNA(Gln) amidotransferase A subunit family amidase
MDKPGPMCRTIEDCAIVFSILHGSDEKDGATLTAPFNFDRNPDLSQIRIGYDDSSPEEFVEKLRELGADLRPMPERPRSPSSQLGVESSAAFEFYVTQQAAEREASGEEEPAGGRRGRFTSDATALDYLQTQRRRLIVMNQMAELMEGFDMYVGSDTGLTNETGHPAVVVPTSFQSPPPRGDNPPGPPQPLTTTIIGQLFADDKLLSVAHAYQQSTDWHTRRPSL